MGTKHLNQLLNEDQEPFVLKNYIDEKRCQLRKPPAKSNLHIKKRKPISGNSTSLCKNVCFSNFLDSPELKNSPLFYFSSPPKSPCRRNTTDALFIHIPTRTAALLLEAAVRIQTQSGGTQKTKPRKNLGFGFFGSILSKLSRKRSRKLEFTEEKVRVSVKDVVVRADLEGKKRVCDLGVSCSCDSRFSGNMKNLESSTSRSRVGDCKETEFNFEKEEEEEEFNSRETGLCTSSSPFRFVLVNSSSPIRRFPEPKSPETSPSRRKKQVAENDQGQQDDLAAKEYEEEEKEHSSPVSVLDPQFEEEDDDDDGHDEHDEHDEDNDGLELERSFAMVQRTKQKLLHKLRRFEQLAELDPVELEKRILEEEEEGEGDYNDDVDDSWSSSVEEEDTSSLFVKEVLSCSNSYNFQRVPSDIERLVLDLVDEEKGVAGNEDKEMLVKKLCRRLDSWKDAKLKTIDMMVEFDLRREGQDQYWGKNEEQVQEISGLIELGIFRFLVEELSEELVYDHSRGLYL